MTRSALIYPNTNLKATEQLLIEREGPESIVAFVAEPITGASGVIVPPAGCYERDNLYNHANEMGAYLQSRLRSLQDHEHVGEVRGAGLIAAVELAEDKTARTPAIKRAKRVTQLCQDNGLILRNVAGCGLAVCPPLIISRAQVDEIVDKPTLSIKQAA